MKNLYLLGFPINLTLELLIQFLSLLMPINIVIKSIETNQIIFSTLGVLLSLFLYPLTILLLSAVITRLLPKPKFGYVKTFEDALKFQTLIALNTFVRRTPARWLLIFPFPGYYFYKLSGTKINKTALVTSPDSLQDVYAISIGKDSLLGWGCLVLGHYSGDGSRLLLGSIIIGDNVLIGEGSTIWPNVTIGNNSLIQNKSVVMPGTIIPANEIWGGIPAKKIRNITEKINSIVVNFSTLDQELKQYLKESFDIQLLDLDQPLLSSGLSVECLSNTLRKLEKKYDIFISRAEINIDQLSFNQILVIAKKQICLIQTEQKWKPF